MCISARSLLESPNVETEAYTIEQVHTLTYLGTKINKEKIWRMAFVTD